MVTGSVIMAGGGSSTSLVDVDGLGGGRGSTSARLSKKASTVVTPLYKGLVSTVGGLKMQSQ